LGQPCRVVQRLLQVALHFFEERLGGRRIRVHQWAGELQLDGERDEVLLRALVEVTLDPPAVGIGSKNEPRPGRAQLGNLGAQPLKLVAPCFDLLSLQSYRPPRRGLPETVRRRTRDVK
jgi:hypothetical protein